jgi:hypothetical protein
MSCTIEAQIQFKNKMLSLKLSSTKDKEYHLKSKTLGSLKHVVVITQKQHDGQRLTIDIVLQRCC